MLEFLLCSLVTILPDFLVRRYVQDKRWGREINFYTVWYELRWGLTGSFILTVSLITLIFYYHPTTTNVSSFFRTVTILSETGGRVTDVYVTNNQSVKAGDILFRLDDSSQVTAAETARSKIIEVEAALLVARSDFNAASGAVKQAQAAYKQTKDEFDRKDALRKRGSSAVSVREIERLQNLISLRQGALDAATSSREASKTRIESLLPAQKATAEAALAQAGAELAKTEIFAGVDGTIEQFTLRPGDYVNPILRPAGILVPANAGRTQFQAGFEQTATPVLHVGMVTEVVCVSKPFTITPMVITAIQDVIPAGQIRPSDRLTDIQERARPGTITVFMEPLYAGQTDDIPPGSKCFANAYTNNHDKIAAGGLGVSKWLFYHMVDTVGIAHAFILRMQALILPVQTLVFSGH